jgi:hypothetical protein
MAKKNGLGSPKPSDVKRYFTALADEMRLPEPAYIFCREDIGSF